MEHLITLQEECGCCLLEYENDDYCRVFCRKHRRVNLDVRGIFNAIKGVYGDVTTDNLQMPDGKIIDFDLDNSMIGRRIRSIYLPEESIPLEKILDSLLWISIF